MREQDWPDEAREAAIKAHAEARNVAFPNAKDERAVAAVFAALASHVTPTAPLRELVDQWSADVPSLTRLKGHERGLTLSACADELREVIDRG